MRKGVFLNQCKWTYERLMAEKRVGLDEFKRNFEIINKNAADSIWCRIRDAILAILKADNKPVDLQAGDLVFQGEADTERRYETQYFRPYDHYDAKQSIGKLVAFYLKRRPDRHVLLGSGSTVYHVGVRMREYRPYKQLFWTVNLPLLADWCENKDCPVDEVQVPEGTLKTKTSRYASMQPPPWDAPIVVVGADGCLYKKKTQTAWLYANDGSVAANTNLFIQNATDTVICGLASEKLEYDGSAGQNAGPRIKVPDDDEVQMFLVTDHMPADDRVIKALEKDRWKIITEEGNWPLPTDERQEGV